jgi:adenine C2-methylase RlmN of 23S rRNA A2503 and tRNA A37
MNYFTEMAMVHGLPLKIHFSLHSPLDDVRKKIIPSATLTVADCLEGLAAYRNSVASIDLLSENLKIFHPSYADPAEIHYTVIDGVNDSDAELESMILIGKKYAIPLKLLKFNPTKYLRPSHRQQLWAQTLREQYGAPVVEYSPPGAGVGASCGQFTKHFYVDNPDDPESLEEFRTWRGMYEVAIN